MTDITQAGELAQAFVEAVDRAMSHSRRREFFSYAGIEETMTIMEERCGQGITWGAHDDLPERKPDAAGNLRLANIYATLAERAGNSEEIRKYIPAELRNAEARELLCSANAASFSKLCK